MSVTDAVLDRKRRSVRKIKVGWPHIKGFETECGIVETDEPFSGFRHGHYEKTGLKLTSFWSECDCPECLAAESKR